VTGISDLNATLTSLAPREGINLIRATVQDIAQQLAKSAIAKAPDDPSTGSPDLKSSIKAKRRRGTRVRVGSDVIVLPAAFYWRFLEYGDGPDGVEHAFFLSALQEMRPDIDRVYLEAFVRKLTAKLARERKKRG
jgi:HK97 gp10 family phage protein